MLSGSLLSQVSGLGHISALGIGFRKARFQRGWQRDEWQTTDRQEAVERQMRDRRRIPDTEIQADGRRTINKRWADERAAIDRK